MSTPGAQSSSNHRLRNLLSKTRSKILSKASSLSSKHDPQDTRERLIESAKKLFSSQGYNGTTVKEIADLAGVNVSLVSYHFNGKEGLYQTCLEQFGKSRLATIEKILKVPATQEEFKARLELFLEDFIQIYLEESELCQMICRDVEAGIPEHFNIFKETFFKFYEKFIAYFEVSKNNGLLRSNLDSKIIGGLLMGGVLHITQKDSLNQILFGKSLRDSHYRKQVIEQFMVLICSGSFSHSPLFQTDRRNP